MLQEIAVIITCHNRRTLTLQCLERLDRQILPVGYRLQVYVTDDGSTDGSGDAIGIGFPHVRVIPGSGHLYWCGGMRTAWRAAIADANYEYYLWLNDDTGLFPAAISSLLEIQARMSVEDGRRGIAVGSTIDPSRGIVSYGAFDRGTVIAPTSEGRRVRTFNGNCVLIHRDVVEEIGMLSEHFSHSFGDIEYGLRASSAGIPVWVCKGFVGECGLNPTNAWCDPLVPLFRRWRVFHSPKGLPPAEFIKFLRVSVGNLWPLVLVKTYIRLFFPRLIRTRGSDK